MATYVITAVYEVERVFEVEADSEDKAIANTDDWQEVEEITLERLSIHVDLLEEQEANVN